jgi:dipeptidyl aminopeptidase/acylaminoacyl peptidase
LGVIHGTPSELADALRDRYAIERELGRGGMATVYLAHDLRHDRDVALKVLRPELAAVLGRERFLTEIRLTAKLDHPHILTLIDSGESNGSLWYVIPYVRGESLRDRLNRLRQLAVDDALAIIKQIGGALDYAHQRGIIHRDIKPENILFHEGEAMLADFGIALAVKEAGGNRVTETGLSLGTPQYMSPEQATGDRQLDARTDVYSMGAVLYEMLAGEPPHTGATAQAVIAKLMTERPTRLRAVRDTVPEVIDAAVTKALAKVPADRFPRVADFIEALDRPGRRSSTPGWGLHPLRTSMIVLAVLGSALVLALLLKRGNESEILVVRDRTQVTFSGNARSPAISADGKQLAYVLKHCVGSECTSSIEVQDIEAGAGRRAVVNVPRANNLRWSSDRRFLLFRGEIGGKWGAYVVPTIGGSPQLVGAQECSATFHPTADSLLISIPTSRPDTVGWMAVATLRGERRDSTRIHLEKPGLVCEGYLAPGGQWIIVETFSPPSHVYRVTDRAGRQRDVFSVPQGTGTWSVMRSDALWMQLWGQGFPILRIPFDGRNGRYRGRADTLLVTATSGFDVSEDGTTIAYVDGTDQYDLWALQLSDALKGRFLPERRLESATSDIQGRISPDGTRVLVVRNVAVQGRDGRAIAIVPLAGGTEVVHRPLGSLVSSGLVTWSLDGRALTYAERVANQVRFVTVDASTGTRQGVVSTRDSTLVAYTPLADGWAWIPSYNRIRVWLSGQPEPRDLRLEDESFIYDIAAANGRSWLASVAINAGLDSAFLDVTVLPNGRATRWAKFKTGLEWPRVSWLADGSLVLWNQETETTATLYRIRGPARVERLGTIPRALQSFSISLDGHRAVLVMNEFKGDVWLAHVARAGGRR